MFGTLPHTGIDPYQKDLLQMSDFLHNADATSREGRISRIGMIPGILYVLENDSQRTFGINLRELDGYCGESPKELGFTVGAPVRFLTRDDQQIVTAAHVIR